MMTTSANAARVAQKCEGRVLIFATQGSSTTLVRTWWPDLAAIAGRDIWLDDTPNITPTYIQAQIAVYAPVRLVVVDGWELLLLDGDELPTRRDPRLLMALTDVAQKWAVPVMVCSPNEVENGII